MAFMLKMDLSLTEGLAEELCFHITDLSDEAVNLAGMNFTAYLKRRGEDEVQLLKAEHGAAVGELVVHMPACTAGVLDWELWRSTDAAEDLFLGGCVTVFSVARVVELALHGRTQRQFAVRTQESGPAWQVRALPGNAAEATLEKIREAYRENIKFKSEIVSMLPAPEEADVRCIYYYNNMPYLVVDGQWVRFDSMYDVARIGVPGLMNVQSEIRPIYAENGEIYNYAVVVGHKDKPYFCVEQATKDSFGVVKLSDDFNYGRGIASLLPGAPVYVRRASIRDSHVGLVAVEGSEAELAETTSYVDHTVPTVDRAREIAIDEAKKVASEDKLDTDMGNLAPGLDVVVSHSYDAETGDWWRLWKSGWCEQGGMFVAPGYRFHILFPKEMLDTNYVLFLQVRRAKAGSSAAPSGFEIEEEPRTTFDVTVRTDANLVYMWQVKGMAREIVDQVVL